MELYLPDQIVLNEASKALIGDLEETARRVNEYRPLPSAVVKRIEDSLLGDRVYSSNAIEGSTLDYRETVAVLNTGKILENKKREAIEARNLGEAVNKIQSLVARGNDAHTVENLFDTHRLILRETSDEYWGGRFREQGVTLTGAKYQPPDYSIVPALVERLMDRLKRIDDHLGLPRACWSHWALTRIHPFKDGNGRIARLWQDLVLFQQNLTCAVILPEERRGYLDALTAADEGDFNALVQLTAQRVLETFDKYLTEIAQDKELESSARELAGEADTRIAEKKQLSYQRWARKVEQLRFEFEIFAARVTNASGRVRIQIRRYDLIDKATWEAISTGGRAERTSFFDLYFDAGGHRRRYIFFFGKHYPTDFDTVEDRSENRLCLLISEDDGSGKGVRLDQIDRCPLTIREIFLVNDLFVVRQHDPGKNTIEYQRGIAPLRIAQDFIRDVVLRRLT